MKNLGKALIFLALMSIYLLVAGGPGYRTLYGQKLALIYGFGAVIALWFGGWSIGTLEPSTMRPVFIALGVVVMIVMFILLFGSRDVMKQLDRGANPAHALDAAMSISLDFGHNRRRASLPFSRTPTRRSTRTIDGSWVASTFF